MSQTRVKDIRIALWTPYEDFPVLRIVIDAEPMKAQHQTFCLLPTSEKRRNFLLIRRKLIARDNLGAPSTLGRLPLGLIPSAITAHPHKLEDIVLSLLGRH